MVLVAGAFLGGLSLLGGCRRPIAPDVLLVTLDTVRADHTTPGGSERDTTPRLARLAQDGVIFSAAYAPMPMTAPSHAAVFSGRYPINLGVTTNGVELPRNGPWLPEQLLHAGYETAGFVSSFVVGRQFGWARGFERFDDRFVPEYASVVSPVWEGFEVPNSALDQRATVTTDKVLEWIAQRDQSGRPFFVWVHYFDPHTPYDPPEGFEGAFSSREESAESELQRHVRRYDEEILYTDHELGRLLDGLTRHRQGRDLLLVVLGDHGESFLEHGHVHHGLTVYEEAVRVPLLFHWPGRVAPARLTEPAGLVDVAPTLLGMLGVTSNASEGPAIDGHDLSSILLGRAGPQGGQHGLLLQRRSFAAGATDELFDPPWAKRKRGDVIVGEQFGWVLDGWKYIECRETGRRELYALTMDPKEREDVSERDNELALVLGRQLRRFVDQRRAGDAATTKPIAEEERARLRALGYLP